METMQDLKLQFAANVEAWKAEKVTHTAHQAHGNLYQAQMSGQRMRDIGFRTTDIQHTIAMMRRQGRVE